MATRKLPHERGPEPIVRLVRFWPDHFLPSVRPQAVLFMNWNWHFGYRFPDLTNDR